jgi:hypothetical protein
MNDTSASLFDFSDLPLYDFDMLARTFGVNMNAIGVELSGQRCNGSFSVCVEESDDEVMGLVCRELLV